MLKTLKKSILLVVIALGILLLSQTTVNATEIDSANTLKEVFNGTAVTINETTVTLTGDVTIDDVIEIMSGEYVINLNGHTLTIGEFYICDGKLTINDSDGKGKLVSGYTQIGSYEEEPRGELVINNGNYDYLDNCGTLTVNNGTITGIFNTGILTIENGNFGGLSPSGKTTINGGKFSGGLLVYQPDVANITITGGEWNHPEDIDGGIVIYGPEEVFESSINDMIPVGYEAVYDSFETGQWSNSSDGTDITYEGYYKGTVKIVKATDNFSDIFKKITADGIWEVNALKPSNWEDAIFLLEDIANTTIDNIDYYAVVDVQNDENGFNPEIATISFIGESNETHRIKIKYLEPSTEKAKTVNSVLDKMKYWADKDDITTQNSYILDDLYLINYLFSNAGARVSSNDALNFAKELINATNGANISYKFDSRAGGGGALYTEAMGQVIVYYAGEAYTSRNVGLVANRVIYIPEDTANNDEAYIAAALKRIKDYIGQDANITITVGGTLESLNDGNITFNEHGLIDETTCGTNYYNVKINGNIYTFAICKKDTTKLETPKYVGSNLESKITITSDDSSIPLDTAISVKTVVSEDIEKVLGTNIYAAYDISLYSNAREISITELKNGKFVVSIPVPEILKDKIIAVYYINSNGEKEEHSATVKDGIATFETDHFSTYVLAEAKDDANIGENTNINNNVTNNNPPTGDNILLFVAMLVIAVIGIIVTTKLRKDCESK